MSDVHITYFKKLSRWNYKFVDLEFWDNLCKLEEEKRCLSDEEMEIIMDVLTEAKLSMKLFKKLLYCAIPENIITEQRAVDILCWILSVYPDQLSKAIVALQWVVALLETGLIEKDIVEGFYFQYFFMLDYKTLDKVACRLIYMLTGPDDISRSDVEWLLDLRCRTLKFSHFDALLSLFKSLCPELVPEKVRTVNVYKALGGIPSALQEAINERRAGRPGQNVELRFIGLGREETVSDDEIDEDDDSNVDTASVEKVVVKKQKPGDALVPQITYIHFGAKLYRDTEEPNLHDFKTVTTLSCYILSVGAPSQTISLLGSDTGRALLLFDRTGDLQRRLSYNLALLLDEVYIKCRRKCSLEQKKQFLNQLASFQDYAMQGIPVVSKFVKNYLIIWEGGKCLPQVLHLMQWLHFESHVELANDFFSPLYTLFVTWGIKVKSAILRTLGQLFSNIMLTVKRNGHGVFLDIEEKWSAAGTLESVLSFASYLITHGFNDGESLEKLTNEALSFYEQVIVAEEVNDIYLHFQLPPVFVFSCFFSLDITAVSRICSLLGRCSEILFSEDVPEEVRIEHKKSRQLLVSYCKDISNALHGKLMQSEDGFFNQNLPQTIRDDVQWIVGRFGISDHPAIALFVHHALRELEASGTSQQRSADRKKEILRVLEQHFPEIYSFFGKSSQ